jgi:hypothetical protein
MLPTVMALLGPGRTYIARQRRSLVIRTCIRGMMKSRSLVLSRLNYDGGKYRWEWYGHVVGARDT